MMDETTKIGSAAQSPDAVTTDNAVVLGALGVLAYVASMMTHEALGHGGFCVATGGVNVMLTAWGERCTWPHAQPMGIEAAGPGMQFAAGLVAWLALHLLPSRFGNLRCFGWLYMLFCLLVPAGYIAFSGVTDFGDAAVLIAGATPQYVWRGMLIVAGAIAYYLSMRAGAFELMRFAGSDTQGKRLWRLVWIPYLAAGAIACCGGALNQTMSPGVALGLAAASSFGGSFGMLRLPDMQRAMAIKSTALVSRVGWSFAWVFAAVVVSAVFLFVLGPGLDFASPPE